jgi:hypothetical protein
MSLGMRTCMGFEMSVLKEGRYKKVRVLLKGYFSTNFFNSNTT